MRRWILRKRSRWPKQWASEKRHWGDAITVENVNARDILYWGVAITVENVNARDILHLGVTVVSHREMDLNKKDPDGQNGGRQKNVTGAFSHPMQFRVL